MSVARAVVLAALLPLIFLFTPLPKDNNCLHAVPIAFGAKVEVNCDAWGIIEPAVTLTYPRWHEGWRSPGLVLFTAALAPVLSILPAPIGFELDRKASRLGLPSWISPKIYAIGPIFNLCVLLIAFWLARQLVETDTVFALFACIATCDLTQGWFWQMHAAYLNLLVPLGCVYCLLRRPPVLLFGAMVSVYPGVGIWIAASFLGQHRWWWLVAALVPTIAVTTIPLWLGWPPMPHAPTNDDQFIWLFSAHPDFGARLVDFWHTLVTTFLRWPVLLMAVLLPLGPYGKGDRDFIAACVMALAITLGAVFLVGNYAPRLFAGIDVLFFLVLARARMGNEPVGGVYLWLVAVVQVVCAFLAPAVSLT